MLDKNLCIKCRRVRTWWNKHDDVRWIKGNVVCVVKGVKGDVEQIVAGVNGQPPKHCLFALEHVVSEPSKKEVKRGTNRTVGANA